MSSRKAQNYLEWKDTLTLSYLSLRDQLNSDDLKIYFDLLIGLDEIIYKYNVEKSYLEYSNHPQSTQLIAQLEKLIFSLEDECKVGILIHYVPRLAILRRELVENANEAGRLIHSTFFNTTTERRIKQEVRQSQKNPQNLKQTMELKWSEECMQIIADSAAIDGLLKKYEWMSTQFEQKLKVKASRDYMRFILLYFGNDYSPTFRALIKKSYADTSHIVGREKQTKAITDQLNKIADPKIPAYYTSVIRYYFHLREAFINAYGVPEYPRENLL